MTRQTAFERHSIDYVPRSERHGKVWHLWPVWFSGSANLATQATGVLGIAMGGNLFWTASAVLTGCAFGTFFMAFHSTQGPQLGLPQMIQSRPQFGYAGALLVWIVALITYIGFNAFNQALVAQTMHELFAPLAATSRVPALIFTGLALILAALGYDKIRAAQRATSYLLIALLTVFTAEAAFAIRLPPSQWDPRRFAALPFLAQFFAAASYQLSWSIYVSDYSRYLPRDVGVRASFWWTYLGALLGGAWMMLVGSFAAAVAPQSNVAAAIKSAADAVHPGFGAVLLGGSVIGLLLITTLNFYGASLTLLSMVDTLRPIVSSIAQRIWSLLAIALAATLLAMAAPANFAYRFNEVLALLLYFLTPWTAINLVDFYIVRKGRYSVREIFNPRGIYGRWNGRGLLAYSVGFLVMIPFFSTAIYTGPVARALGGADVAMLAGLPVSALVYLLAYRCVDIQAELRRAAEADRDLDCSEAIHPVRP